MIRSFYIAGTLAYAHVLAYALDHVLDHVLAHALAVALTTRSSIFEVGVGSAASVACLHALPYIQLYIELGFAQHSFYRFYYSFL